MSRRLRFFLLWSSLTFLVGVAHSVWVVFWFPVPQPGMPPQPGGDLARAVVYALVAGSVQSWVLGREFERPWQWLPLTFLGAVLSVLTTFIRGYLTVAVLLSAGIAAFCQTGFFLLRVGPMGWIWLPVRTGIAFACWWMVQPLYTAFGSAILAHFTTLLVSAVGQGLLILAIRHLVDRAKDQPGVGVLR
jgi:hypothetical protein